MAEKKYGHFDDDNREYVITDPQTPWPWINYLGNEDFFSLISNTAGGYSFYKDAKFRRITRYRAYGQWRPLFLYQGRRHRVESRMEALQDSTRQLRVPSRYELYPHYGKQERCGGKCALLCSASHLG